ncbi:MAG TPA: ANTAR domain-containing protein [Thermodesulfobacteriota bacterium]
MSTSRVRPAGPRAGGPAPSRGGAGAGRRSGIPQPTSPIPALLVGDAGRLSSLLERMGAAGLIDTVAVLTPEAALEPGRADAAVSLVVAPWPEATGWLAGAAPRSPLGGTVPILLVGGEPPRGRLLVETPGPSLPAALRPAAAGGPLAGLVEELSSLRDENRALKEALEARKAIERAKGILMEQEGISEGEAFSRIQRLSMTRRKSMREISEAIILSREVSNQPPRG